MKDRFCPSAPAPVLVAACGNTMAGDDAFGPLTAAALRARSDAAMEVVDLGMKPVDLLNHNLAERVLLILVDAAFPEEGFSPGALVHAEFRSPARPQLVHDVQLSSHGLSLAHELELAEKLDMLPPAVQVIAAAAGATRVGEPASPWMPQLVARAVQLVAELVAPFQPIHDVKQEVRHA